MKHPAPAEKQVDAGAIGRGGLGSGDEAGVERETGALLDLHPRRARVPDGKLDSRGSDRDTPATELHL